jgi:hypothetical protein
VKKIVVDDDNNNNDIILHISLFEHVIIYKLYVCTQKLLAGYLLLNTTSPLCLVPTS